MDKDQVNIISALKPLCHDVQKYNALMDYFQMRIKIEQKRLEDLTDPIQIHRSQGKVHMLRALSRLRDEVINREN
jgi:hypothetical protein